jgi:hypothetical protein
VATEGRVVSVAKKTSPGGTNPPLTNRRNVNNSSIKIGVVSYEIQLVARVVTVEQKSAGAVDLEKLPVPERLM